MYNLFHLKGATMAINLLDSQGTRVYIAPAATALTTPAEIQTAYASAKLVGCIQDLGSMTKSRNVQEYSCLSSDEIAKSLGSVSLGNMTIGMLFDPTDTAGQKELKDMFSANTRREFIVGLSDGAFSSTTSPTCFVFTGAVSSVEVSIQKDNAVMINATVEFASIPLEIAKDAV